MSDFLTGKPWAQAPWELVTADISAQAFRVVMAIQLHRRPEGKAPFPGHQRLADMCHVSVPTVVRAISELKAAGILRAEQRRTTTGRKSTCSYRLSLPTDRPSPVMDGGGHRRSSVIDGPSIIGDRAEVEEGSEVERTPSGGNLVAAATNGAVGRPRDEIWDALTELFGSAETESARTKRGKVVRSLAHAGATGDEIATRAAHWPDLFEGATLTELALEKHWGQLDAGVKVQRGNGKRYGRGMTTKAILEMADKAKKEGR